MPAGNAYPSGHLVPSPIVGLACAPIVETRFLELAMSLLDFFHLEYPLVLSQFCLHKERQCKAGTIAGIRSAIASIHQGWQNSTVSNNADLSKLIKGIFNTSPMGSRFNINLFK